MTDRSDVSPSWKPSLKRLVFTDYASLLCFLFPITSWILVGASAFGLIREERGDQVSKSFFFLVSAIAATVIFVPLFFWRMRRLLSFFREGVAVPARITSLWFVGDRGRIDYEYTFEGQIYRGGMPVAKTTRAKALQQGQQVTVLVRPANPAKSIILELFCGPASASSA